jgi:transcriptional regulator with XRE-family HTH domain
VKVETTERIEIAAALRRSVEESGLSQAEFARAIGTSGARLSTYLSGSTIPSAAIYLRAIRLGSALAEGRANGLMTPDETATTVNKALREGDEDWAFRMILQARDDLRATATSAHREALRNAWTRRTRRIEDQRFDILFRAIIAHEFGSDAPEWTQDARLDDEWVMDDPFRDSDTIRRQTPPWLAAAGVYIAERGLGTA